MKSILARLVFLAAMIPVSAAAQTRPIPGSDIRVGGWLVRALETGGRFARCGMGYEYRTGALMFFWMDADARWRIGWSNPRWRHTMDQKVSVEFSIDGLPAQTVEAVAGENQILAAELPVGADLFDQLRLGNVINVRMQGASYVFNLTNTSVALTALRNCVSKYKGADAPAPSADRGGPPASGPVLLPRPNLTADQRLEGVRLMANLMARMPGFQILNEEEQKAFDPMLAQLTNAAVVWRAQGAFGYLLVYPAETEARVRYIASATAFGYSQACDGQSEINSAPDVRSSTTRRVHVSCASAAGSKEIGRFIVMPFGKQGVYVFVAAGTPDQGESIVRADDLLRNALFEVVQK